MHMMTKFVDDLTFFPLCFPTFQRKYLEATSKEMELSVVTVIERLGAATFIASVTSPFLLY